MAYITATIEASMAGRPFAEDISVRQWADVQNGEVKFLGPIEIGLWVLGEKTAPSGRTYQAVVGTHWDKLDAKNWPALYDIADAALDADEAVDAAIAQAEQDAREARADHAHDERRDRQMEEDR